jgi:hypothetical protein
METSAKLRTRCISTILISRISDFLISEELDQKGTPHGVPFLFADLVCLNNRYYCGLEEENGSGKTGSASFKSLGFYLGEELPLGEQGAALPDAPGALPGCEEPDCEPGCEEPGCEDPGCEEPGLVEPVTVPQGDPLGVVPGAFVVFGFMVEG